MTTDHLAALDPVLAQAISTLIGAISMAIIAFATYYFPRDHSNFELQKQRLDRERRRRRRRDSWDDEEESVSDTDSGDDP
jgi:hypothetical protein